MIKLYFPLNINLHSLKPIFRAKINNKVATCMLDTGADIPVFCKGLNLFNEWTKEMDDVEPFRKSSIGGFGKDKEDTILYNIPSFQFSDNKNHITYNNVKIAVMSKSKIPCDLILSASLFMKMRYTIDCLGKSHFLTIEAEKDNYGVGFYSRRETIYIFMNETKEESIKNMVINDMHHF